MSMTESEARKEIIESGMKLGAGDYVDIKALEVAVKALEEVEQYRAIGTVEDVAFYKKCYEEESYEYCGEYGTDTCACKNRMEYLEKKISDYESIGTIEEFKALKQWKSDIIESFSKYDVNSVDELMKRFRELTEKAAPKKPILIGYRKDGEPVYECGCCGATLKCADQPFCMNCSCKVDWQ